MYRISPKLVFNIRYAGAEVPSVCVNRSGAIGLRLRAETDGSMGYLHRLQLPLKSLACPKSWFTSIPVDEENWRNSSDFYGDTSNRDWFGVPINRNYFN